MASQYPSHVTTAATVARAQPITLRIIGVALWCVSYFGNVLAFGGGVDGVTALNSTTLMAILGSLVYQAVFTWVQVVFCNSPFSPGYLTALLMSFVPSFIGYRPIIAVPLGEMLSGVSGDPFASVDEIQLADLRSIFGAIIATAFMSLVLVAVDVIPERVYIKH